jgi:hypothetical protein
MNTNEGGLSAAVIALRVARARVLMPTNYTLQRRVRKSNSRRAGRRRSPSVHVRPRATLYLAAAPAAAPRASNRASLLAAARVLYTTCGVVEAAADGLASERGATQQHCRSGLKSVRGPVELMTSAL